MTIPKIELREVTKTYPGDGEPVRALLGLTLEAFENEITCLVGPSGCGKTTTLNLVAGFDVPTSGKVLVGGRTVKTPDGTCGFVFQADSVFPWMTIEENVAYGLRFNGTPKIAAKELVTKYLDMVGLSEFRHRWPRELSGGMRKRVDLARAYAFNPQVLLLDEPFGSLDVLTKEEMQLLLLRIWRSERKTVLFVTHDVEEAVFLGHRVAVSAPRPGFIKQIFDVPFEMPRELNLKLTREFLQLRRQITQTLRSLPVSNRKESF